MKIVLIGYGKMGKAIEAEAIERNHTIVARVNQENKSELPSFLAQADVAIEFTRPDVAIENIKTCLAHQTPVVVGTTGWHNQLSAISSQVEQKNGALLHASNFSIGVNLFFALNSYLAKLMNNQPSYTAKLDEIHHTQKLDEPSGTAITLANQLIAANDAYTNWKLTHENPSVTDLPIEAFREGDVKGTHSIAYSSPIDTITIKHEAHSRKGFALGAVLAAEWILAKRGVFTMKDVLGL